MAFNYGSSGASTFSAVIGGTGPVVVTAGRLNLTGVNTYTGDTFIKGGTVYIDSPTRIAGNIALLDTAGNNSATFMAAYANQTFARNFTVNAGSAGTASFIFNQGNEACTFSGAFNLGKDLYVTATSTRDDVTLSGIISGEGGIIKMGGGADSVLSINNTGNTYEGKTIVLEGGLRFGGTISNTAGIFGIPAAGNEEILLGATNGTGNAALATGDATVTMNRPLRVRSGSSGSATIYGSGNNGAWVINTNVTLERELTIDVGPQNSTIGGRIYGSGPGAGIYKTGAKTLTCSNTNTPTHITTRIGAGVLQWNLNALTPNPTSVSFGVGLITLSGGSFELYATQDSSGADGAALLLTNSILVSSSGGGLYGWQGTGGSSKYPNVTFSGPIDLGESLRIGSRTTGGGGNAMHQTGLVTIAQTSPGLRCLYYYQLGLAMNQEGNIGDGGGLSRNPLVLFNSASSIGAFNIMGANNTYAYGTIIRAGSGPINVAAGSRLGTGNVIIQENGRLILNAPNNIAAGKSVEVAGSIKGPGILNLQSNFLANVSSNSTGVVAIDTSTFDAISNMATAGNGAMFLGSAGTGVFTGTILGAGTGNVYRLGGARGTLTINNGVLTGAASVVVGSIPTNGQGTVRLLGSNSFTGGITVNYGSTLIGQAQTGGGTPFGDTNGTVALKGGTLRLDATNTATTNYIGAMTLDGFGRVYVDAKSYSATTILSMASLSINSTSRDPGVGGYRRDVFYPFGTQSSLTNKERIIVAASMDATNKLPGYYIVSQATPGSTSADFATYDSNKGFGKFTNYITADGTWSNITNSDMVVSNVANATLSGTNTIWGLKMYNDNCMISGTATVNVDRGGIIVAQIESMDSVNTKGFGSGITLAFGDNEGMVFTQNRVSTYRSPYDRDAGGPAYYNRLFMFNNKFTGNSGLTIHGPGLMRLENVNVFAGVSGPITVHQAWLICPDDDITFNNDLLMDGANIGYGKWNVGAGTLTVNGKMTLLNGGLLICPDRSFVNIVNLNGSITGSGTLSLDGPSTFTLKNSSNDYSGGTILLSLSPTVDVTNNSSLGTGPVCVRSGTLTLMGNSNISSTAAVSVDSSGTVRFKSDSPSIGALEGLGAVVLGNQNVNDTTLTVGSTGNSMTFYGAISQSGAAVGQGIGNLNKAGSGTFTFKGTGSYTGLTSVAAGKLVLDGSLAGSVSVATNATLTGNGVIGGSLTLEGGSTYLSGLNGTNDYGQLSVTGIVSIAGNSILSVSLGYTPSGSDVFYIMLNSGTNAINGTFSGLTEGSVINLGNGLSAKISYQGNGDVGATANDIKLYDFTLLGCGTMVIIE